MSHSKEASSCNELLATHQSLQTMQCNGGTSTLPLEPFLTAVPDSICDEPHRSDRTTSFAHHLSAQTRPINDNKWKISSFVIGFTSSRHSLQDDSHGVPIGSVIEINPSE